MSNQQTPEKTVMEEVMETLITRTATLEKQLTEKNEALLIKEQQTQMLLTSFEKRFNNIIVKAPEFDTSGIKAELHHGLTNITNTVAKWPTTIKNEYRFTLFPEQLRSVDYVRAVLTRVILGLISLVFLIFTYLLIDKHIH